MNDDELLERTEATLDATPATKLPVPPPFGERGVIATDSTGNTMTGIARSMEALRESGDATPATGQGG